LKTKLAAAKRALPAVRAEPWAEDGPPVPIAEGEVIDVLYSDMHLPVLPFEWPKTARIDAEKLRRWLRTSYLHDPTKSRDGDPSKVRFALVWRPSSVRWPRHVDADTNEGGEIVADVTLVDLGRARAMCGAPVHATNGARLSFATGGPAGLTPQEALEVDLRRTLQERAHMTLIGLPRCRALPPPP